MRSYRKSGFTLIELLVVIAIIAVLAVVVVLTLNPGQLMMQARDGNRLSDLANLQTALNLYVTDASINGSVSLGSSSVTYVSVPDPSATTIAGSDCSGLGFPSGGLFHCAASSTYRKTDGTGWIPVNLTRMTTGAAIGQWPVDPQNSVSSGTGSYWSYATDGTTWKVAAVPESQKYVSQSVSFTAGSNPNLLGGFPNQGWVTVPGNGTFGTQTFSVMKYDAVCSDGKGNYLNDQDSGYHTYSDSSKNCTSANSRQIASLPGGWPIANISHTSALLYCQSIGAHLLTNDEYMTIATNAAGQSSNWSGGSPGSGYMYSGHNDNAPANALPADASDANGYSGETNTGGNQRRTLTLSNGSVVWDFAGNVWQHVQRSVNNAGDLTTTMALPACTGGGGWNWCQYGNTLTPYISAWSSDVASANVAPPNSSWNSSQGMGQVYTYGTGVNQGTTVFLRGADWSAGSGAGAFALNVSWGTGNTSYGVGFRCAR
jgi:prepilin-type N-terminal cleavage/methylation domain-containing protein